MGRLRHKTVLSLLIKSTILPCNSNCYLLNTKMNTFAAEKIRFEYGFYKNSGIAR